jgi:hypothetical protein
MINTDSALDTNRCPSCSAAVRGLTGTAPIIAKLARILLRPSASFPFCAGFESNVGILDDERRLVAVDQLAPWGGLDHDARRA